MPLLFAMGAFFTVVVALRRFALSSLSVEGGSAAPKLIEAMVLLSDDPVRDPFTGDLGGIGVSGDGAEQGVRLRKTNG